MNRKRSRCFYLPYEAAGSLSILPGPTAILLMIVSISAGADAPVLCQFDVILWAWEDALPYIGTDGITYA